MSTLSRSHFTGWPLAVIKKPAMFSIGPVGPCSPGIHFGYTTVNGPAVTGITSVACRILRGASVRSTLKVIGAACAPATELANTAANAAPAYFIEKPFIVPPSPCTAIEQPEQFIPHEVICSLTKCGNRPRLPSIRLVAERQAD